MIPPNNKNIVLAAELANDLSRRNIVVIPTTSVPQGITAAINIDPEASVEDNKNNDQKGMLGDASIAELEKKDEKEN